MDATRYAGYRQGVLDRFAAYRRRHFAGRDVLFEPDLPGQMVFRPEAAHRNYFDPALYHELTQHPRSCRRLGNPQALAVSVFGTLARREDLGLLAGVPCSDGRPAVPEGARDLALDLERPADRLYEEGRRARELWLTGRGLSMVIAGRLLERDLGPCPGPERGHCDGSYARREGGSPCWHSDHGAFYWRYLPGALGWESDREHRPCPLRRPFGLVRSLLALAVDPTPSPSEGEGRGEGEILDPATGRIASRPESGIPGLPSCRRLAPHPTLSPQGEGVRCLLVVYDARNPAFAPEGPAGRLLAGVEASLRPPLGLRRTTWQAIAAAMARSPWYSDLLGYLREKYGVEPG